MMELGHKGSSMRRCSHIAPLIAASLATIAGIAPAAARASYALLYSFAPQVGEIPTGPLLRDRQGNLFGTATYGGRFGYGSVFELSPPSGRASSWQATVLYSFGGGLDGSEPLSGLTADAAGNLYGTTPTAGRFNAGVIYRMSPPAGPGKHWTQRVLYAPRPRLSEGFAQSTLVLDAQGNIYGTYPVGGAAACGSVFRLSPAAERGAWSEAILYAFDSTNCRTGGLPSLGLAFGRTGALYGMTTAPRVGVADDVYQLTPPASGNAWTEVDLHDFGAPGDGDEPLGVPVFDAAGNLFATTESGGQNACLGGGCGTVFTLTRSSSAPWPESVLYEFTGLADGGSPTGSVTVGRDGTMYVTTLVGGDMEGSGGAGTVVALHRHGSAWTPTVLHTFGSAGDGAEPSYGLVSGKGGALYGTTIRGGSGTCGCGTVYEVTP